MLDVRTWSRRRSLSVEQPGDDGVTEPGDDPGDLRDPALISGNDVASDYAAEMFILDRPL